jgi:hypothetical protein
LPTFSFLSSHLSLFCLSPLPFSPGYDFLIDEDCKVWLLEVNTNPYIGFSSTMLA